MKKSQNPFRFLLMAVSGWMSQQQLQLIDYLRERTECCANNCDKDDYASTMTSDADARQGQGIGKNASPRGGYDCHPETLLAWYRRLIARGSSKLDATDRENRGRSRIC